MTSKIYDILSSNLQHDGTYWVSADGFDIVFFAPMGDETKWKVHVHPVELVDGEWLANTDGNYAIFREVG
jgi:hypothetical protein